jgi:hypothetical protein
MITPEDEAAYQRWLYGSMGLVEAFAMYRQELEEKFEKEQNNEE